MNMFFEPVWDEAPRTSPDKWQKNPNVKWEEGKKPPDPTAMFCAYPVCVYVYKKFKWNKIVNFTLTRTVLRQVAKSRRIE